MKQIDKLLLKSFIGPFLVSFGIALFVLIMQFLWLYIDEIAGKGVSIFIMLELIGYLSISTFPMAFPIAVLIASVMVMGNMAERYELSSFKSAGVSLLRVMRPLFFVCLGISFFSYITSDILIPKANLKFRSRLFDIRKQKPALSIEQGTFNDDFRQFIIRVGEKAKDGETIKKIIIEDQSNSGRSRFNQTLADSGQMFTTRDNRFFVMNLYNGAQYQEPGAGNNPQQRQQYPFIRTNFKSWSKVWDMQEFEMNVTDEERFKTQRSMLTIRQLQFSIDSLYRTIDNNKQDAVSDYLAGVKKLLRPDTSAVTVQAAAAGAASISSGAGSIPNNLPLPPNTPIQQLDQPVEQYASFLETFPAQFHKSILNDASRQVKLHQTSLENRIKQIDIRRLEAAKTGYELYTKHSFALVCLVFLFIGGPMGALIRKGGFGYPILVSISFFVTFIFLTILCRKLAESYILTPFWAAMMPCIVMIPLGAFLTRRAVNDAQLFSTEGLDRLGRWIMRKVQKDSTIPPAA